MNWQYDPACMPVLLLALSVVLGFLIVVAREFCRDAAAWWRARRRAKA